MDTLTEKLDEFLEDKKSSQIKCKDEVKTYRFLFDVPGIEPHLVPNMACVTARFEYMWLEKL